MGTLKELEARVKKSRAVIDKLRKEAQSKAKKDMADISKEIFRIHPVLQSYSWNQYTPYFMDGDECIFGVNLDYMTFIFKGSGGEIVEFDENNDNEFGRKYDSEKREYVTTPITADQKKFKAAIADVKKFLSLFEDEDMKYLFGDHVTVTVNTKGATTDECSHD